MVLSWRNDENIRKWMYNGSEIEVQEHLNFIDKLFLSKDKQYLVVKKEDVFVGAVYFNNIDFINGSVEFGLYANPFSKLLFIGLILEKVCIKYAFDILRLKKLQLEVFSDNKGVINLHKKFAFKEYDKKIVNDKEVILMQLNKNEI